jgi:hypothetical protein
MFTYWQDISNIHPEDSCPSFCAESSEAESVEDVIRILLSSRIRKHSEAKPPHVLLNGD